MGSISYFHHCRCLFIVPRIRLSTIDTGFSDNGITIGFPIKLSRAVTNVVETEARLCGCGRVFVGVVHL